MQKRLSPGGGVWGGSMGMSRVAVKAEALPLQLRSEGLYVVDAIELASALCLKAIQSGPLSSIF